MKAIQDIASTPKIAYTLGADFEWKSDRSCNAPERKSIYLKCRKVHRQGQRGMARARMTFTRKGFAKINTSRKQFERSVGCLELRPQPPIAPAEGTEPHDDNSCLLYHYLACRGWYFEIERGIIVYDIEHFGRAFGFIFVPRHLHRHSQWPYTTMEKLSTWLTSHRGCIVVSYEWMID